MLVWEENAVLWMLVELELRTLGMSSLYGLIPAIHGFETSWSDAISEKERGRRYAQNALEITKIPHHTGRLSRQDKARSRTTITGLDLNKDIFTMTVTFCMVILRPAL